ncbi:MAG TPA: hypothetical protein VFV37_00455 [Luteibaculaceae bacterium]|nr:hypothetical protein [Luteibaculaceae bacterium]
MKTIWRIFGLGLMTVIFIKSIFDHNHFLMYLMGALISSSVIMSILEPRIRDTPFFWRNQQK